MFGYIKPFKPHLRICEYETYQAVYCGLCKKLGKKYGFTARMTLSYDFAFLGLLEYALNNDEFIIKQQRCIAHPYKKSPCLTSLDGLEFTAAAATILIYHKLRDDISDKGFIKKTAAKFMLKFMKHGYKQAENSYPELSAYISDKIIQQNKLEAEKCKSIDRASEPTANILGEIMTYLSNVNEQKDILRRIGYFLGRYIYIIDAFDDVIDDFASGGFNPLILGNAVVNELGFDDIQKKAEDSVNFTLGALADIYVQLEFERFKPIIDNIIYLGLKKNFYDISAKKKEKLLEQ